MANGHSILRCYRLKHGLSPAQFAKKLGVAPSTLRSLENGTRGITDKRALDFERRLDRGLTRAQLRPDLFGGMRRRA